MNYTKFLAIVISCILLCSNLFSQNISKTSISLVVNNLKKSSRLTTNYLSKQNKANNKAIRKYCKKQNNLKARLCLVNSSFSDTYYDVTHDPLLHSKDISKISYSINEHQPNATDTILVLIDYYKNDSLYSKFLYHNSTIMSKDDPETIRHDVEGYKLCEYFKFRLKQLQILKVSSLIRYNEYCSLLRFLKKFERKYQINSNRYQIKSDASSSFLKSKVRDKMKCERLINSELKSRNLSSKSEFASPDSKYLQDNQFIHDDLKSQFLKLNPEQLEKISVPSISENIPNIISEYKCGLSDNLIKSKFDSIKGIRNEEKSNAKDKWILINENQYCWNSRLYSLKLNVGFDLLNNKECGIITYCGINAGTSIMPVNYGKYSGRYFGYHCGVSVYKNFLKHFIFLSDFHIASYLLTDAKFDNYKKSHFTSNYTFKRNGKWEFLWENALGYKLGSQGLTSISLGFDYLISKWNVNLIKAFPLKFRIKKSIKYDIL